MDITDDPSLIDCTEGLKNPQIVFDCYKKWALAELADAFLPLIAYLLFAQ